ncbi:hypothetical protein HYX13_01960 [Candidatus Woesearchaeota archaeon]|nr:hypothetical protein [Candidatus Woesearchaeota archaeon]
MSLLNKLAFWKKEDEFDFDKEFSGEGANSGISPSTPTKDLFAESPSHEPVQESPFASSSSGNLSPSSFQQRQFPESRTGDAELLNSKLDTLRAQLSAIEQRLANIERLLGSEQKQRLW